MHKPYETALPHSLLKNKKNLLCAQSPSAKPTAHGSITAVSAAAVYHKQSHKILLWKNPIRFTFDTSVHPEPAMRGAKWRKVTKRKKVHPKWRLQWTTLRRSSSSSSTMVLLACMPSAEWGRKYARCSMGELFPTAPPCSNRTGFDICHPEECWEEYGVRDGREFRKLTVQMARRWDQKITTVGLAGV